MKRDDGKRIDRVAVPKRISRTTIQSNALQGCLGVLAGFWLVSADAQVDYKPLILDNPRPRPETFFGAAVAELGDVNGDGLPDIAAGAPGQDVGRNEERGRIFVFGGPDGSLLYTIDNPDGQRGAYFGGALAGVGDVDGDGKPDLLVGARWYKQDGNLFQGRAYVFSGADGHLLYIIDDPTPQQGTNFGEAVASAGDVDGDGTPDLLIAAPGQDVDGNESQGQAFVFSGTDGRLLRTLNNPMPNAYVGFGFSIAGAGDLNGDGASDLAVAAPWQPVGGVPYVGQIFVFNGADGSLLRVLDNPTPEVFADFGSAMAGAGDVNGDGKPDLLVGAPGEDPDGNDDRNLAFVFSGADGSLLHTLDSPTSRYADEFARAVASAGDVNGDGRPDLLVGAPGQTVDGNDYQGRVFVFSGANGRLLHTLDNPTPQAYAGFGKAVAGVGDMNGDGKPDLLVGAEGQDVDGSENQGQAVLFVSTPDNDVLRVTI